MRLSIALLLTLTLAVGAATAGPPAPDAAQLVARLSARDAKARKAASEALLKLGPAALPALKTAAAGKDARLALRAQALVTASRPPPSPRRSRQRPGRSARRAAASRPGSSRRRAPSHPAAR